MKKTKIVVDLAVAVRLLLWKVQIVSILEKSSRNIDDVAHVQHFYGTGPTTSK